MIREEIIGDARLLLGDCREILPTLGGVDSIVTDPPFGMDFRSNHRLVRHEAITNDSDDALLTWACSVPVRHSRYVFCRWDNLAALPKPRSFVTWVKNNWSMGDLDHEHARQTEGACFWPGPEHYWPKGRPTDVVHAARTGNEHHPTEKPVSLMLQVVEWTAGTVVDPFCGSGSTGVACARLGRPFVGIEIDPRHFATAVKRVTEAYRQGQLFQERPPKPVQIGLLDGAA